MELKFNTLDDLNTFEARLNYISKQSRFKFNIDYKFTKKYAVMNLKKIRLKKSKPYCGNHPAECEVTGNKPVKGVFLEGLDWIAINDMLNDIADDLCMSVDIKTIICRVRQGKERRISYDYHENNNQNEWDYEGSMVDNTGKPPISSDYPDGTPGIATYLIEE